MLNWDRFKQLPGAKHNNFELICRSVIRNIYAKYGEFRALSNQPGVEFHLNIKINCDLGDIGRWYGWQCKWHEPNKNGSLKAATKRDIEDSLTKTKTYLPCITDWVLWVPYQLVKKDEDWYFSLKEKTGFDLHLYSDVELEDFLNSDCLALKRSYFGELAITEDELAALHSKNVKPIERRWFKDVHIESFVEKQLRAMLGERLAWSALSSTLVSLKNTMEQIDANNSSLSQIAGYERFAFDCNLHIRILSDIEYLMKDGRLAEIKTKFKCWSCDVSLGCHKFLRKLRRINHPIALHITNALADMTYARKSIQQLTEFLDKSLIAVLSEAGGGKTQLAAQVTSPTDSRPAGILILGQWLGRGSSLDNLAKRCSTGNIVFNTFEELLLCLDSAAQRAKSRLPLVIDGLNEAENPKDWKTELAILGGMLKNYPNVLVICTLRLNSLMHHRFRNGNNKEAFVEMCLPEIDIMERLRLDGFGDFTENAIRKYCKYYKIKIDYPRAPVDFLKRPLNLFIFCEVTNPGRSNEVTLTHFPSSLTSIFSKYIEYACNRIFELKNLSYSYSKEELSNYINIFGITLWESGSRSIDEQEFRRVACDMSRNWDSSIVNLLSQEGIIFRDSNDGFGNDSIYAAYDSLGGFIIAKSLLLRYRANRSFKWLEELETYDRHDLADDIFKALVALTPTIILGCQLWKGDHGLREKALRLTSVIEPEYLDDDTTKAFIDIFTKDPQNEREMLGEFMKMRCIPKHKLNANVLNDILTPITISNRDLSWSEWIRSSHQEHENEVLKIESVWKEMVSLDESDYLLFQWIKWLLTTTVRNLRDYSTRALYWFGRNDPQYLFTETIESVSINDPYVFERMLAASYGVCMALQTDELGLEKLKEYLPNLANVLYNILFKETAQYSTSHILIRKYATGIIDLSDHLGLCHLTVSELNLCRPPYLDMDRLDWQECIESRENIIYPNSPILMDFGNYTIGRLVFGRRNYDFQHEAYRTVRSQILWRIRDLGWRKEQFSEIDESIDKRMHSYRFDHYDGKIDRYGKKYSWIAYFEMAGKLDDQNFDKKSSDTTSNVDIDPSFPEPPDERRLINHDFLSSKQLESKKWIETEDAGDFVNYLKLKGLNKDKNTWIALNGLLTQNTISRDRELSFSIRSFIINNLAGEAQKCKSIYTYDDLIHFIPNIIYTFSGEIPWSPLYPEVEPMVIKINHQYEKFKIFTKEIPGIYNDRIALSNSVCEFEWESYHSVINQAKGTIPCKQICLGLDLVIIPQTLNMGTKEGDVVTQNFRYNEPSWCNTQNFLFIREDYLKKFLVASKLHMVWIVKCDKNFYPYNDYNTEEHLSSSFQHLYTDIQLLKY